MKFPRCSLVSHAALMFSVMMAAGCTQTKMSDLTTVSAGAKEQKLYERIEHFNRARYWGSATEAVDFVAPAFQPEFLSNERKLASNQRIVRSEVAEVKVDPETASTANVELEVQYFEQPTYVVRSRREKQAWAFDRFNGGWRLTKSELVVGPEAKQNDPGLTRGRMRGLGSY